MNLGGRTTRIQGKIGEHSLMILFDSGSTHSFLNSRCVMKLGLTCERTERLQVLVANDNKIKSPGQSRDVPIAMGNQLILIDFNILTLNRVDVVLGVNWLQIVEILPIIWQHLQPII